MARSQPLRRERIGLPLKDVDPAATALRPRFEEYLENKRAEHSDKARKDLRHPFELFCRWLTDRGQPLTLASFTLATVEAYRDDLRTRPALPGKRGFEGDHLSVHSQHAYLRPLRQFGDYLSWAGWLEISPFELSYSSVLPNLSRSRRILKLATPDDIRLFLAATRGDDALALRDRACLLVAWETGMRTQDLVGLDVDSVDLRSGVITIRDSKGDNDRQVKVGVVAMPALTRYLGTGRPWLVERAKARLAKSQPGHPVRIDALFLSEAAGGGRNRTGRLTENGLYELLVRRWHQAGRTGSFGAHRFRHGLATLLSEANVSIDIIAHWLGDSIETIRKTYSHPTPQAMHAHIGPVVAASLVDLGYRTDAVRAA